MAVKASSSARRARLRRSSYFVPLPIVSLLVAATVLAGPNILHATFTIFDDGLLKIDMRIQQITRRSTTLGNVFGIMTVTNDHPFAILLINLRAVVVSGTFEDGAFTADPSPVVMIFDVTRLRAGLLIPANSKVTKQFFASMVGDLTVLSPGSDFFIEASQLAWAEIRPDGSRDFFETSVMTVCVDPLTVLQAGGVGADSCQDLPF